MNHSELRTYQGKTMREVLNLVRNDLGEDALIVSQSQANGMISVQASLQAPVAAPTATAAPAATPVAVSVDPPAVPPVYALAAALAGIKRPALPIHGLQGGYRFVGASGVGKTSTLIKVLVEWVMHNGSDGVTVVSCDDQRLGATEPLHLTCQLLGVRMLEVDQADLPTICRDAASERLLLVDSSAAELSDHASLVALRDIFVVSAQHSITSLQAQTQLVRAGQAFGCVVTHLDQPFAAADLAKWLADSGLSVFWLGSSAYLPGGLEVAADANLARYFGQNEMGVATAV